MKKLYFAFITSLSFSAATAQTDQQLASLTHNETKFNAVNVEQRIQPPVSKAAMSCDSLLTTTAGGNGFNGNMFDITVAQNFTLETFSVSMDAGTWNVAIYYRTGTYVGSTTSSTGWTFLDSASITSSTTDASTLYKVPVNLNLPLMAGNTYGFYVTGTNSASPINYTDGTSVGAVYASNATFSVKEGHGGAYPFNLTNSPRIFNGEVFFCNGITGIDESGTARIDLYPSPASQSVTIDLTPFNGNVVKVRMTNALGQVLQSNEMEANGQADLDLNGYEAGIYFVQVELNGKVSTTKLAVK